MDREQMLEALKDVQAGRMAPEAALKLLAQAPYEDIGYAKIDHHRGLRNGTGEVIYGAGKTAEQIVAIASRMVAAGGRNILVTRMDGEKAAQVAQAVPLFYDAQARLGVVNRVPRALVGSVVVASGGTSDLPVCEEAALTAETLGSRVTRLYDVGVAGLHRLLSHLDELQSARAVVAVAGMEGALASVIGGLVDCPVIAVPTSVGYGVASGGSSALSSMLSSCAPGLGVLNIDNGYGAACAAARVVNAL